MNILTLLAILLASLPGAADHRGEMVTPPLVIFERMLHRAEEGEIETVRRSVDALGPVLMDLEQTFGAAERKRIVAVLRSADSAALVRGVRLLVSRDIAVLLRAVQGASQDRARTLARTALLEWKLLETFAQHSDPKTSLTVSAELQAVVAAIEAGHLEESRSHVLTVERALLELFRGERPRDKVVQPVGDRSPAIPSGTVVNLKDPGIVAPVVLETPRLAYPVEAERKRIGGTVELNVLIDEEGRVVEAQIVSEPSGEGAKVGLAAAALEHVKKLRYRPAQKGGLAVKVWMPVSVKFRPPLRRPGDF